MFRFMLLVGACLAAAGAAVAGPAPLPRGGPGTLGTTPAPRLRGGPGTLGGFMNRRPSLERFRRPSVFFGGGYYGSRYYNRFYYLDPFVYDPFYFDAWGSPYQSDYGAADDWSRRGNVQLHVDPKDVEVIVDGIPSAKGGRAVLSLPAGKHQIEIVRRGYRPWRLDLDVQQGVRYRLEQDLERLPKEEQDSGADLPSSRRVGELRLDIRPADAILDLDGRLLGMADLLRGSAALRRIPLGRHQLRVSRPGYKTVDREIVVSPERPTEVSVELERE